MPSDRRPASILTIAAVLLGSTALAAQAAPPGDPGVPGVPRTLAASAPVGTGVVDPAFPVDFVAVTWTGEHGTAEVRFRHGARWGGWQPMGEDGVEEPGRFGSALVSAEDADAYQVRVPASAGGPRSVAINTTDGPVTTAGADGSVTTTMADACATTELTAPIDYVRRCEWGADESLRFDSDGEIFPRTYFPVQKLTVHHTATANDVEDPAATMRAIYRYHAVDRGWGDIGYQFLVGEAGQVYEGRYTDDDGTTAPGYESLDDGAEGGVVAAHVAGWNSGNLGVAILGTFTERRPTAGAQRGLEWVLAELARRSEIDPTGDGPYTNPVDGNVWRGVNIPAHRDFSATEDPGRIGYALLPTVRERVAARKSGTLVEDAVAPLIASVAAAGSGRTGTVTWTTDEPSDSQIQYWRQSSPGKVVTSSLDLSFVEGHSVALSGLRRGATYGYRVISADIAGNRTVSTVQYFTVR